MMVATFMIKQLPYMFHAHTVLTQTQLFGAQLQIIAGTPAYNDLRKSNSFI